MNTLISTWKRNNYGRKFGAVLGLLFVSVMIGSPSAWAGCTYVDPQVSASGYEAWCRCMNGTYYERPYRCVPGPNWGRRGTIIEPPPDYWKQQRQREERKLREEAERRRRMLQEAEEAAKRREEEAIKRFNMEKERTIKSLKGASAGPLELKGATKVTPFGIKGTPDEELELKSISRKDIELRAISTEWKQHYCGRWITGYTFPAAQKGDVEEVRFLGTQAIKAFRGGPLELQCEAQPAPKIYEGVVIGPDSTVEKFYMKILRMTEKEAVRMMEAEKQIWKVRTKKQKANNEVAEKQQEVNKIKEKIKQLKKATTPPAAESEEKKAAEAPEPKKKDTKAEEKLKEKKHALEAALAALKMAQKAEADVDETIAKAEKERSEAQNNLKEYEDMFNMVEKEPALAESYLGKIGK